MKLYPRLVGARAREIAEPLRTESIATVHTGGLEAFSAFAEEKAPAGIEYGPTGGARIKGDELAALRTALVDAATRFGFDPESGPGVAPEPLSKDDARAVDVAWAICLHMQMGISRDEAAKSGVWAFLGCILVPGLVRWRFWSANTPANRFTGSLQRNTFYRLWWRAETLCDPAHEDPYWLLAALMEDEQVQLTERPTLIGCRPIVMPAARLFIELVRPRDDIGNQMAVMRQLSKRMLRVLGIIAYELMTPDECEAAARQLVEETLEGMQLAATDDPLTELSRPAWMSKLFATLGLTTLAQVAALTPEQARTVKGVGKAKLRQLDRVLETARTMLAAVPEPVVESVAPQAVEAGLSRFSEEEGEVLRAWAHLEITDQASLYAHSKGAERRDLRKVFFPYERFYEALAAWQSGVR